MPDSALLPPFAAALLVHGIIGGTDVLLNHELIAKLPSLPNAGAEQGLHCARELVFAVIFIALAWWEPGGVFSWAIAALFLAELIVSTVDTVLEVKIRVLPVSERILHVLLFVNLGIVMTLLAQVLPGWAARDSGLRFVHYGWASWVLSAMAGASLLWSLRDGINVLKRRRRSVVLAAAP
ncbi:MAG: hypothetical protein V4857_25135 [Pseudomonadota bacterium]